jgi:integrase
MGGFVRQRKLADGKARYYVTIDDRSYGGYRTRRDAEAALRKAESEIAAGTYGRENPTLKKFYKEWIAAKQKTVKPGTLTDYELTFRLHILPGLGDAKLPDITPADVQAWVDSLSNKKLSPSSVNKSYRYLRNCLNNAVAKDLLDRSPCRGIIVPKSEREEFDLLDASEVRDLLGAAEDPERTLFAVLAYSGLRLGEALGLKWRDIDFEKQCIRVERTFGQYGWGTPKTQTSRRAVPLSPLLAAVLVEYRSRMHETAPDNPLFSHDGTRPLDQSNTRRDFNAALKHAGLRHVTIHSLRHFFATNMLASGCSIKALQRALGHSSATMTLDTYAHFIPESAAEAVTRFDALVSGEVAQLRERHQG